jgi:hypothetical protein
MVFAACDNDTELLFEETATERKKAAISEYDNALKSSANGWAFEYFPDKNQSYGGYNFVLKFDDHDKLMVWYEGIPLLSTSVSSTYDIISYGGPVLSFDTFNNILHQFANPSATAYNGKGGDFEFLMMSHNADTIHLKGTKTGNLMRLIKLNERPAEYLQKVRDVQEYISKTTMATTINNSVVEVVVAGRHLMFNYEEEGEEKSELLPFIYTPGGIRLYESTEILGKEFQEFTLQKSEEKLVSDQIALSVVFPPIDLSDWWWVYDVSKETENCAAIKAIFDQVYNANTLRWGEKLYPKVCFGKSLRDGSTEIGLSFISTTTSSYYVAHYQVLFAGVYGHDDYINMHEVGSGFNWRWYTHLDPFVSFITENAPYKIEIDDDKNPSKIKFTSVDKPEIWFHLDKLAF